MRLLAMAICLLVVPAVPPSWHTFRSGGVSVRYPPTWHATAQRLTPVTAPAQALAVASYPIPARGRGGGCAPSAELAGLPADGALIFGWEYGDIRPGTGLRSRDFPPRPKHFRLVHFAPYECLGPSYMLRFRAGGRAFQIHVALGRRSTAATRRTVLRILDSFRVTR